MGFESLVNEIRRGGVVTSAELLPYLSLADSKKRSEANLKLAEAYADTGDLAQAAVFVRRAWVLSGFSSDILQFVRKSMRDYRILMRSERLTRR